MNGLNFTGGELAVLVLFWCGAGVATLMTGTAIGVALAVL